MRRLIHRISESTLALAIFFVAFFAFQFASSAETNGVPGPQIDCKKRADQTAMTCRLLRDGFLAEPPWWTIRSGGERFEVRTHILEFKYPSRFEGVSVRYRIRHESQWRHQEGIVQ